MKDNSTIDRLIFYGFCGLFFLIPVGTSPAVIAGLITISLWVFSGKFIGDIRQAFSCDWAIPAVLLLILPWVGMLYTEDAATGLSFAKKTYYWLYAFAIAGLSRKGHQRTFANAFLAGLSFSVAIAMAQLLGLVHMPKGYATGFFGGEAPYITYSLLLVFGMLLLSFHYKETAAKKQKALLLLLAGLFFFNLEIIPGRSGYLTFTLLCPLILLNILGKKNTLWAGAVMIALVAALFSSSVVRDRVTAAVNDVRVYYKGEKNTPIGKRLYMWDGAVRIFIKHPVLGVGTGGYKYAMRGYRDDPELPDVAHPHNSFLYVAATHGIAGLAAFLWLMFVFLKKGWRARDELPGFTVIAFGLVLFIGSLTDTQYLSFASGNLFALLVGLKTDSSA